MTCMCCRIWIMSVLATLMSFCYAFIGLGLSIARATGDPPLACAAMSRAAHNAKGAMHDEELACV